MTLYKHFPSKEVLVEAVLERREEGARRWLQGIVEREDLSAEERLALLSEGLGQGCGTRSSPAARSSTLPPSSPMCPTRS